MNIKEGYVFEIQTNEYAGNFEREMCAYCTGEIGIDDDTGKEYIPKNIPIDFKGIIKQCPDDNGTLRPCDVGGEKGHSVLIFFDKKPSEKHIEYMKSQATNFAKFKRENGYEWDKDFELKEISFSGITVKTTKTHENL